MTNFREPVVPGGDGRSNPRNNIAFCRVLSTRKPKRVGRLKINNEVVERFSHRQDEAGVDGLKGVKYDANGNGWTVGGQSIDEFCRELREIAQFRLPEEEIREFERKKMEYYSAENVAKRAELAEKEAIERMMSSPEAKEYKLLTDSIIQMRIPGPEDLEEWEREGIDEAIDISSPYAHLAPAARVFMEQNGPNLLGVDVSVSEGGNLKETSTELNHRAEPKEENPKMNQNFTPALELPVRENYEKSAQNSKNLKKHSNESSDEEDKIYTKPVGWVN